MHLNILLVMRIKHHQQDKVTNKSETIAQQMWRYLNVNLSQNLQTAMPDTEQNKVAVATELVRIITENKNLKAKPFLQGGRPTDNKKSMGRMVGGNGGRILLFYK